MDHLPRIYISDRFELPKQQNSAEIFVNMQNHKIVWFNEWNRARTKANIK